jgi:hypothetical protein
MAKEESCTLLIECTECCRSTNHDVLHEKETQWEAEEVGIFGGKKYRMLECRGCGAVSFEARSWDTEDTDFRGNPHVKCVLYPSRSTRKPMEEYYYLPNKVRNVYLETLIALSNKAPILAAIGVRAVVEGVCKEKSCIGRNLEKSIDQLVEKGHLASDQADFLHLQRFMGNTAAHEVQAPEEGELTAALAIAENLLTTLYILPQRAEEMKKSQVQLAARKNQVVKRNSSAAKTNKPKN